MVNHIKLYEIAATAKNFEMFKAKYGRDVSDEQLKSIFDRFNKQQSRLQIKDIFKYASLKDLTSALETKSGKEVERNVRTSEANILVDNEKMMIVEPLTMAASLKYGAHTKWCTTYPVPEENQFNNYFSKVTLVYFIDKIHKAKYAIAYDKNDPEVVEAFDEKDESIDFSNVLKFFSVTIEEISNKTISLVEKNKIFLKNFSKEIESRIVGDVIKGNIDLYNKKLAKITDVFDFSKYKVEGGFNCAYNQLTSLTGAPREVGGNFYCHENQLTSLVGAPVKVRNDFRCNNNQLTSLTGAPKEVGGHFSCDNNPTKFSKEDIQNAMKGDINEIFIQKENNMDKIPQYYSFFTDLIAEGHCIMADVPQKDDILEFIKKIPNECVYEEAGENYGKDMNPHVTVMHGLSPVEETRVKELLTKVPKKIVAELGKISKFSNTDTPYDVLKIEVKSPHLNKIHEIIRKNFDNNYKWPQYNPHVTLAYVKKGTCNEYVGNKTFEGMKVMFEAFMYSNGIRELNHAVPMKEYNDSKKSESSVKKELDALSSKYREHLESWISVDDKGISLGNLRALKTAPVGTGTAFMKDLISIADDYGMIITLTTGLRDRNAPEVFKKTTSTDRLKKFYSRFGFKSNYDKRSYRPDLRGNMHREPNKNNMSEYNVGTSGGYGGGAMAGGPMAPMGWAGTNSSPQTSRRLKDYPASRRYTYMQGNTVIGSSLYDTITNDDLTDKRFSTDEMFAGFRQEMQKMEFPDKDVARPIVVANLLKNPKYYSDLDMYFNSDKI